MPSDDPRIPVVVVESHQHVLEHVHAILRRRARLRNRERRRVRLEQIQHVQTGAQEERPAAAPPPPLALLVPPLTMVHFDSHPDLACPSPDAPAGACFEPRRDWPCDSRGKDSDGGIDNATAAKTDAAATRNLYEFLDLDRSGIAQWILPLVASGDLDTVHWIRSKWADQFVDGMYRFNVGGWVPPTEEDAQSLRLDITSFVDLPPTASVKVDLRHPYYIDDDAVVPTDELMLPKRLDLMVSELPATMANNNAHRDKDWILDICLDYFACRNPFIDEIEKIDAAFARELKDAVTMTRFCSSLRAANQITPDGECIATYEHESKAFHRIMTNLLEVHTLWGRPGRNEMAAEQVGIAGNSICLSNDEAYCELYSLYTSPEIGKDVIDRLESTLAKNESAARLAALALDALPSVTLPEDCSASHSSYSAGDILSSALERVKAMGKVLKASRFGFRQPPVIVTIARSSDDGFTPRAVVEKLQQAVLEEVHGVYCECEGRTGDADGEDTGTLFGPDNAPIGCKLWLLHDYGDWEGSNFEV